jgi:lipopolysaccharide/colanic/teichoic acid biosynthesis glycosyltransferase
MSLTFQEAKLFEAQAASQSATPTWKRTLDLTICLIAIPLLLPLMTMIAIAIKILSPGPIHFAQTRVGKNGKTFTCLKFRSMKLDADTSVHENYVKDLIKSLDKPMTKMDNSGDARLIPGFGLIRATGLDELPQLFNVLRGEMSIVGPRPCMVSEAEEYEPWHKERFRTLPGLTGLWQVSGKNHTTFDEMMRLDIRYAHEKTLRMDLSIIVKTIPALVIQALETREAPDETKRTDPAKEPSAETVAA